MQCVRLFGIISHVLSINAVDFHYRKYVCLSFLLTSALAIQLYKFPFLNTFVMEMAQMHLCHFHHKSVRKVNL